jgi:hypothetical protein
MEQANRTRELRQKIFDRCSKVSLEFAFEIDKMVGEMIEDIDRKKRQKNALEKMD